MSTGAALSLTSSTKLSRRAGTLERRYRGIGLGPLPEADRGVQNQHDHDDGEGGGCRAIPERIAAISIIQGLVPRNTRKSGKKADMGFERARSRRIGPGGARPLRA